MGWRSKRLGVDVHHMLEAAPRAVAELEADVYPAAWRAGGEVSAAGTGDFVGARLAVLEHRFVELQVHGGISNFCGATAGRARVGRNHGDFAAQRHSAGHRVSVKFPTVVELHQVVRRHVLHATRLSCRV